MSPLLPFLFALASFARTPAERLEVQHLEAVHAQRIEWMKQRASAAPIGVYQDFRAVAAATGYSEQLLKAAKAAEAQVVWVAKTAPFSEMRQGILFLDGEPPQFPEEAAGSTPFVVKTAKERQRLESKFKQYPDEVFAVAGAALPGTPGDRHIAAVFHSTSVHILARELSEASIRASLAEGHAYLAHDWLCDPTGFSLIATNNLGVFDIGDRAPMLNTRIEARVPVPAKLKLIRNGSVVAETSDIKISYTVKEEGDYRLEAWLTVDGEDRPWIYSNALRISGPPRLAPPRGEHPPNIEVRKDIAYSEGDTADAAKHKLDLYLPKGGTAFPVLMFVHGGTWRTGDRSQYAAFGDRFARLGIGVAIPSYRLMPNNPHPAQIEDAAAAFAWVYNNVAQLGGDPQRIYLVGHSAGGHLVALLALDSGYLKKYDLPAGAIRGVAALSGVYGVSRLPEFLSDKGARGASPLDYVHSQAPPFLITYCQWDYLGLPKQARDFAAALKTNFVASQLVYIPGKSHITEILDIWEDDDPTARAILNFIR